MRSNEQIGKVVEWIDGTTPHHRSRDGQEEDVAAGFAWTLYDLDLKLLTNLIPIISRDIPTTLRKDIKTLNKSLGNFFLWGDGLRDGLLENVLEESDDLKEILVASLVGIARLLIYKIAARVKSTSADNIEDLVEELGVVLEKERIFTGYGPDIEGLSDSDDTDLEDHEDKDRLSISISALATYSTCLMDLLPSMEDTLKFASQANDEDEDCSPLDFHVSGPSRIYILNIYDRFSKANPRLVERLGEANWQRHIALRNGPTKQAESIAAAIEEVPKSVFMPVSLFRDSGLGSSLPAQTSYAPTSVSHTSFVSSQAGEGGGGLRVPPTPKAVYKGIPFSCEICGQTLSRIRNRVDWKRHVFADLKPYICTFSDCKDALRTFPTRKMWETHEFDQHRFDTVLRCTGCPDSFPTAEREAHLQAAHGSLLEKKALAIPLRLYEQRKPHEAASLSCPLCLRVPGKSRRDFVTHVGKHMESIALAALPREIDSDSEPGSRSGSSTTTSNVHLTARECPNSGHQGNYGEAENMGEVFDKEHPDTLSSMANIAVLFCDQGKYEEGEAICRQTLQRQEKVLGKEHLDTLKSMASLAAMLSDQRKYIEAEAMWRQTLQLQEIVLGKEHLDTLKSMAGLAAILNDQGKYEEGEAICQQTLQLREKLLGKEHPDTLRSMAQLVLLLYYQGIYKESEAICRQTLQLREIVLGKEHPDTLKSMGTLALLLKTQGGYVEAGQMYQQALKGKKKVLGPDHPSTLHTVNGLGDLYAGQGRYVEAEQMYQQALHGKEKALGLEHTSTLHTVNALGNLYAGQGRVAEAEQMHQRALHGKEKALGHEHPSTLDTVNGLGYLYDGQGRHVEAEQMYQRALQGKEKALGLDHPSTLDTAITLGNLYAGQGWVAEAEQMHQRTLQGMRRP